MYIAQIDFPILAQDRDTVIAAFAPGAARAREMEGNLAFRILLDAEDEAVTILHRWRDKRDFEAYLASAAFAEIGQAVRPLMAGAPVSLRMRAEEDETVAG